MSSKAQSLLDAAVEGQALDPARANANLSTLEARITAGELGPDFDPGPPNSAPPPSSGEAAIATGAKVAAGLMIVGALIFAAQPAGAPPQDTVRAGAPALPSGKTSETKPNRAEVAAPAIEAETSEPELEERVPVQDGATIRAKKVTRIATLPKPKVADDDSSIDRLEQEMALMSDARRALGRGDTRKALELLNQHRREFPKGEFRRERVVSRVTALCALGQEDAAKRVADRYLAGDSSSVHAQRIQQSCAAGK